MVTSTVVLAKWHNVREYRNDENSRKAVMEFLYGDLSRSLVSMKKEIR